MSNEEKKKKVSEEDLSTLSGGCGKKEIPRFKDCNRNHKTNYW